jgi:uncharacterized membrane protein
VDLWTRIAPAAVAAFLASLVEFVEALTIVLAAGATRGWRSAIAGAGSAVVVLAVLAAAFGPALQQAPLAVLHLSIGLLLLLFGMRWLRKAILRSAGVLGLHDEDAAFARKTRELEAGARGGALGGIDKPGFLASFNGTLVEGLEVIFIVIAVGSAGRAFVPAAAGAAAAGALVAGLGLAVHRPLSRIPENALKFAVGLILTSFGSFWIGEGMGFPWPGSDLAIAGCFAAFLAASRLCVGAVRRRTEVTRT